jgi:hypothetical protein
MSEVTFSDMTIEELGKQIFGLQGLINDDVLDSDELDFAKTKIETMEAILKNKVAESKVVELTELANEKKKLNAEKLKADETRIKHELTIKEYNKQEAVDNQLAEKEQLSKLAKEKDINEARKKKEAEERLTSEKLYTEKKLKADGLERKAIAAEQKANEARELASQARTDAVNAKKELVTKHSDIGQDDVRKMSDNDVVKHLVDFGYKLEAKHGPLRSYFKIRSRGNEQLNVDKDIKELRQILANELSSNE